MMELLEKYVHPGDTMLDVGTGTGILAIAAIKLGAVSAVGVDNDEWSFGNAQENVVLNSAQESVSILRGEITDIPLKGFDLIAANIQRGVIEQILPEMRRRLNPGGRILLSGLLDIDREPIAAALSAGELSIIDELHEKEWMALAAQEQL
jgi:ribosomal protein L11 methyltransferase